METFQTFSEARGGLGLTIFDIDKTLFTSDTKINIKKMERLLKEEFLVIIDSSLVKNLIMVSLKMRKDLLEQLHPVEECLVRLRLLLKTQLR